MVKGKRGGRRKPDEEMRKYIITKLKEAQERFGEPKRYKKVVEWNKKINWCRFTMGSLMFSCFILLITGDWNVFLNDIPLLIGIILTCFVNGIGGAILFLFSLPEGKEVYYQEIKE